MKHGSFTTYTIGVMPSSLYFLLLEMHLSSLRKCRNSDMEQNVLPVSEHSELRIGIISIGPCPLGVGEGFRSQGNVNSIMLISVTRNDERKITQDPFFTYFGHETEKHIQMNQATRYGQNCRIVAGSCFKRQCVDKSWLCRRHLVFCAPLILRLLV